MKKIIYFDPNGMKAIHFFIEGLNFPVAIGTYSEWEEVQVSYLSSNIKSGSFNTEAICRWCISHQIQYRIITFKVRVIRVPPLLARAIVIHVLR